MLVTAKSRRDPFTFSLGGMAGINSYTFVPAIPDDRINKALDARFRQSYAAAKPSQWVIKIENALARFYAGACCEQN